MYTLSRKNFSYENTKNFLKVASRPFLNHISYLGKRKKHYKQILRNFTERGPYLKHQFQMPSWAEPRPPMNGFKQYFEPSIIVFSGLCVHFLKNCLTILGFLSKGSSIIKLGYRSAVGELGCDLWLKMMLRWIHWGSWFSPQGGVWNWGHLCYNFDFFPKFFKGKTRVYRVKSFPKIICCQYFLVMFFTFTQIGYVVV